MIKLLNILSEAVSKKPIGFGSEHIIYPLLSDPNKIIKTINTDSGYDKILDINSLEFFKKHSDIFPIVYKITNKYAIIEKLNTNQVLNELDKLGAEFSNLKWHSNKKRKYSILLDELMEDDNLEYYDFIGMLYYLLKNNSLKSLKPELDTLYSLTQDPGLLKKWVNFLNKIILTFNKTELDIHAEQFGYDSKGNIKLLDM